MGLLDRLLGKGKDKAGGPPPPSSGGSSLPAVPALGRITKFQEADGVGEMTLDDGVILRFGRSVCRGFDPILSARVQVEEVGPHPLGGVRAVRVVPAPGASAELDQLHDERAAKQGNVASDSEAVSSALGLGTITILLQHPPGEGRTEIRKLFEDAGVLAGGVVLEFTPNPVLQLGGRTVQVFIGRRSFPREKLDLRFCGEDFDVGQGFVCLSVGLAELDVRSRIMLGKTTPDPWAAPDGPLRRLTLVARKLLAAGSGVVIHRAGNVAYRAEAWSGRVGDPAEPDCRPFGAWIDVGYTPDRRKLATWGMSVSWHQDLAVEIRDPSSNEEYDRAHGAVLLACYSMVRENRSLAAGELIRVPLGIGIGAYPIEEYPAEPDETESTYEVSESDEGVVLRPTGVGIPPLDAWRNYCEGTPSARPLSLGAYKGLLLEKLRESGLTEIANMSVTDLPRGVPAHRVYVFERGDGNFAVVTCGFGRIAQPNGMPDDDTAHIEFMLTVSSHHPRIASALSNLGCYLHARGSDAPPWGPEHRLSFAEPIGPSRHFALGFVGNVELAAGHKIALLSPVAMTETEYAAVGTDEVPTWIAEHGNEPSLRDRWLAVIGH